MIKTIVPGSRHGTITVPPSKSLAHRHLICSYLAGNTEAEETLHIKGLSSDIDATISCMKALLSAIGSQESKAHQPVVLNAGESGTTLRLILPIACALGIEAEFFLDKSLSERPHKVLTDELCAHGEKISIDGQKITCSGKIEPGAYSIPGNISSQYVSGLLLALPLLSGTSTLEVSGPIESLPYITITENILHSYGISFEKKTTYLENTAPSQDRKKQGFSSPDSIGSITYTIYGNQYYSIPTVKSVENGIIKPLIEGNSSLLEGDWSAGAFFLCLGAMSKKGICVNNLSTDSVQGDKAILEILRDFGANVEITNNCIKVSVGSFKDNNNRPLTRTIDAKQIPDLVPIISVLAAVSPGKTDIINAERLRYKESDRIKSTVEMINSLGGEAHEKESGLTIIGKPSLIGGRVNPHNDHRIAMAAAVAASACKDNVIIENIECTAKSYPNFFEDLNKSEVEK